MTRYKEELRKRGYRLETDYPFFPYNLDPKRPTLELVRPRIRNGRVELVEAYVVGISITVFDNNLNVIDYDFI